MEDWYCTQLGGNPSPLSCSL